MIKLNSLYNTIYCFFLTISFYIKEKILYEVNKKKIKLLLKKDNPLISIILPTFNRSEMLKKRSVISVLRQTYKNFELLIIADGCTDDTEEVVKKFNDKRIKLFKIERSKPRYPQTIENHWFCGPVAGINFGLLKIKGDWIARIDDDDIWTKDHLKSLLDHIVKNKCEFVSSKRLELRDGIYKIINHKISDIHQVAYNVDYNVRIGGVNTWLYAAYLSFFKANMNCWRKKINKVNDSDLIFRMSKIGIKKCFLDKATHIGLPRPGTKEIGLKTYTKNKDSYLKKYNI